MTTLVRRSVTLVSLVGRLNPAALDGLIPHTFAVGAVAGTAPLAVRAFASDDDGDAAGLNPQPLPPVAAALRLAVARTVHAVANAAITARVSGGDAQRILTEAGGDWCGTPSGRIPWPRHWPLPWPPDGPAPIDPGYATPAVQAQAALAFQGYANGVEDEQLKIYFTELAEKLADSALRTVD
ncbi:hypothetical protein GCM10009639_36180 [Kitasatospora putterlickiae]|uniref:Uncharacterized protein n=1 Tax=Kitasatospora putterlickiae TaxID=221725 RepID=A0ABN1Y4Z2_9ACTN